MATQQHKMLLNYVIWVRGAIK